MIYGNLINDETKNHPTLIKNDQVQWVDFLLKIYVVSDDVLDVWKNKNHLKRKQLELPLKVMNIRWRYQTIKSEKTQK